MVKVSILTDWEEELWELRLWGAAQVKDDHKGPALRSGTRQSQGSRAIRTPVSGLGERDHKPAPYGAWL